MGTLSRTGEDMCLMLFLGEQELLHAERSHKEKKFGRTCFFLDDAGPTVIAYLAVIYIHIYKTLGCTGFCSEFGALIASTRLIMYCGEKKNREWCWIADSSVDGADDFTSTEFGS